jgi:hypothetical protein
MSTSYLTAYTIMRVAEGVFLRGLVKKGVNIAINMLMQEFHVPPLDPRCGTAAGMLQKGPGLGPGLPICAEAFALKCYKSLAGILRTPKPGLGGSGDGELSGNGCRSSRTFQLGISNRRIGVADQRRRDPLRLEGGLQRLGISGGTGSESVGSG